MDASPKGRLIAVLSIVVLVIGIAAVAVPLALSWGTMSSSGGSLIVSDPTASEAATDVHSANERSITTVTMADRLAPIVEDPSDAIHWLIPVDAPMSTFPRGDLCSAEQRSWLAEYAETYRLTIAPVRARIHNTADSGSAMSLTNIRLEGDWIDVTPTVALVCVGTGDVATQSISLHADSSPGTWSRWNGWESDPQPEGAIATINLAPGEIAELNLELPDTHRDFEGRIVADLVGEEDVIVVLAENVSFPARPLAGYALLFPMPDGLVECQTPADDFAVPCTYEEAAELLRGAGR